MDIIWTSFGHHSDIIWTSLGHDLDIIRTSFGDHLHMIWGSFGDHMGIIWESFWDHLGMDHLGMDHLGIMWGSSGDHLGIISRPFRDHGWWNSGQESGGGAPWESTGVGGGRRLASSIKRCNISIRKSQIYEFMLKIPYISATKPKFVNQTHPTSFITLRISRITWILLVLHQWKPWLLQGKLRFT